MYLLNKAYKADYVKDVSSSSCCISLREVMVIGTPTHRKELKELEGAMVLASEQGRDSQDE